MSSWKTLGALALLGTASMVSAQEINLSGFASAHVTQQLSGSSHPEYYSRKTNYFNFTKFGLNVASQINEKWSVQSQLLVSGRRIDVGATSPQWNMHANWLFASFRPNPNLRLRFGRQLFPAWMVSENIDVGYMYPWIETPHAVYELSPFKSINGASTDYTFQLNDAQKLTVTLFGGQEDLIIPLADGGNATNYYGSVVGSEVALNGNGYRFRVMGSNYKVKTSSTNSSGALEGPFENNNVKVVTTGFRYDKNNIVVYTEYGFREGSKAATPVTGSALMTNTVSSRPYDRKAQVGYITAGYWFDTYLPHLTASKTKWETGIVEGTQDLYSIGLNHKLNDNMMFKSNIGYSISDKGPAHMENQGDSTTFAAGLDMIF